MSAWYKFDVTSYTTSRRAPVALSRSQAAQKLRQWRGQGRKIEVIRYLRDSEDGIHGERLYLTGSLGWEKVSVWARCTDETARAEKWEYKRW